MTGSRISQASFELTICLWIALNVGSSCLYPSKFWDYRCVYHVDAGGKTQDFFVHARKTFYLLSRIPTSGNSVYFLSKVKVATKVS